MSLVNKIALGGVIIGLVGGLGSCAKNISLRNEIVAMPQLIEYHKLSAELNEGGKVYSIHDAIAISKNKPEEWAAFEKKYDSYVALRKDPTLSDAFKEEKDKYKSMIRYTGALIGFGLLAFASKKVWNHTYHSKKDNSLVAPPFKA